MGILGRGNSMTRISEGTTCLRYLGVGQSPMGLLEGLCQTESLQSPYGIRVQRTSDVFVRGLGFIT